MFLTDCSHHLTLSNSEKLTYIGYYMVEAKLYSHKELNPIFPMLNKASIFFAQTLKKVPATIIPEEPAFMVKLIDSHLAEEEGWKNAKFF